MTEPSYDVRLNEVLLLADNTASTNGSNIILLKDQQSFTYKNIPPQLEILLETAVRIVAVFDAGVMSNGRRKERTIQGSGVLVAEGVVLTAAHLFELGLIPGSTLIRQADPPATGYTTNVNPEFKLLMVGMSSTKI
jgi:hypothetical protein